MSEEENEVRRIDPATGLPEEFDDDLEIQSLGDGSGDETRSQPDLDDDWTDPGTADARTTAVQRAPDSQPATLLQCKIDRMHLIAKSYGIPNYKRLNKAPLYEAIYAAMSADTDCDSCNGQCHPESHVFPGVTVKSPIRTRGKAKAATPSSTGTAGQSTLNSGNSVHDVLLGNNESNFVPDQETPSAPDVNLREQILAGVASASSTNTEVFLTEEDMATAREAVKQQSAALAATLKENGQKLP